MSLAHIANVFFERELASCQELPLIQWLRSHPIVKQLQFLPLLYAKSDEIILVSDLPPSPDPRLHLLEEAPPITKLVSWAPSKAIAAWAKKHRIPYPDYDWQTICTINSKLFSFENSPKLPFAKILNSSLEIQEWLSSFRGSKVLKTPLGTSGSGHALYKEGETNVKRLYMTPVIAEPWVERVLDFSSQWEHKQLLGVTCFENNQRGAYQGTYLEKIENWALKEHLFFAEKLVKQIADLGYVGPIGIDAFIYLWQGEKRVHPIVEINARRTMSRISLQSGKNLSFKQSACGLLPTSLGQEKFTRNLYYKN